MKARLISGFAVLLLNGLIAGTAAHADIPNVKVIQVGPIKNVPSRQPAWWSMAGMRMIRVSQSYGGYSPLTRTMIWDARTTEILSRVQNPRLSGRDVRVVALGDRRLITVREYLLLEVTERDALAENTDRDTLARRWSAKVRNVLPQITPRVNRRGA